MAGKTREFAQRILQYYAAGEQLPAVPGTGLYVTLLSAIPAGTEPYDGSSIAEKEILPGTYRAPLENNKLVAIEKDELNNAMQIKNDQGEVNFGVAPQNMDVSGYALVLDSTTTDASAFVAYEIFTTPAKQREVIQNDTLKINVNGLVIREK